MRLIPAFISIGLVLLLATTVFAGPPDTGGALNQEPSPAMAAPIRLFQTYLSGADGHRCPMRLPWRCMACRA